MNVNLFRGLAGVKIHACTQLCTQLSFDLKFVPEFDISKTKAGVCVRSFDTCIFKRLGLVQLLWSLPEDANVHCIERGDFSKGQPSS